MNLEEARKALYNNQKVRLPEWRGYWFLDGFDQVKALTKDGEILPAWAGGLGVGYGVESREDFEIANGLDFGWAITALKAGKLVTRAGWNGKGMFLFIRPSDKLPVDMIVHKVKSLPNSLKGYFAEKTNPYQREKEGSLDGSTEINFTAYICMKAADGSIVNGWLASQTDMLSEDWQLFEPNS